MHVVGPCTVSMWSLIAMWLVSIRKLEGLNAAQGGNKTGCVMRSAETQLAEGPCMQLKHLFRIVLVLCVQLLAKLPNLIVSMLLCHFLPIQLPIQECGFLYVIV